MLQHTASLGTCSLDISLELNVLFTLKLKEQFQFTTDSWIFEFSESVETQTHLSFFSEEHDEFQKQDNSLVEYSKRSHDNK
jgi:phosphoribulokinase